MRRSGCYCGARFTEGVCPFRCPPEADPANLRAQRRKRRAHDKTAAKTQGVYLTPDEARAGERASGTKTLGMKNFRFGLL